MNPISPGAVGIGLVVTLMTAIQLAWYVAVIVLLVKIWNRVKGMPISS